VNFYRRFIRDFSTKTWSLFDLKHSKKVWIWSGKEQVAFEDLKTAVITAPVLMSPQDLEPFWIEADSSDFAMGAVLSQQSTTDGKWHSVAFYSKSLSSAVMPLENFLWKCSMGYTLYPWISLLEPTLETSYKPQT